MSRLIAAALAVYLIVLSVALPSAQAPSSGQSIFRFDTFGSEQLWTDFLQMQNVIAESVSPKTALSVGLKVDVDALPAALIDALKASPPQVDLDDPAVTVQLLKLNAVVGVIGRADTAASATRASASASSRHPTRSRPSCRRSCSMN